MAQSAQWPLRGVRSVQKNEGEDEEEDGGEEDMCLIFFIYKGILDFSCLILLLF